MAGNLGSVVHKRVLSLVTNYLFDNVVNREISAKPLSNLVISWVKPRVAFFIVNVNGKTSHNIFIIYPVPDIASLKKPSTALEWL